MSAHGWIGVDLDGTLAEYSCWVSETHIGPPVELMVARVKRWVAQGRDVRIFTARANPMLPADHDPRDSYEAPAAVAAIKAWCREHIGVELPVVYEKDYLMVELWDDRARAVIPNTGIALGYSVD